MKYRINPDFVVPEPTAANHFSYFPLPETQEEFDRQRDEAFDLMRKHGAKKGRLTIIDDEHPIPPYPNGVAMLYLTYPISCATVTKQEKNNGFRSFVKALPQ